MKKLIAALLIIIILLLAGVYFFIPGTLNVSNRTIFHCSAAGAGRVVQQKENWKKFWPGSMHLTPSANFMNDDVLLYNQDTFHITQVLQNALSIRITGGETNANSNLMLIQLSQDSVALDWSYSTPSSVNPFARIKQYRQAVDTKKNMTAILNNIKAFLSKDVNIYGIAITQTSTKDTFLISTNTLVKTYPTTTDIYKLINKLQVYAIANSALQTGDAMINVTQLDAEQYKVMAAIPTNKMLNESGDVTYKRMVPGRFLTATVTGGNGTVNTAYNQLQQYFQDYGRTSMAIPFQYLVTDRSKEQDTSKWVTKLYFPVM